MNILAVADIVGKPGRRILERELSRLQREENIGFIVANGENAAAGRGINREIKENLLNLGVDVITMGNHVWDNKDIFSIIDDEPRLIRPANYPAGCPGQGYHIYRAGFNKRIAVINMSGRVFMPPLDCPFQKIDEILVEIGDKADIILIDFHAEASSEKTAFANYVDGRVSAVFGTHTHVQTSDERILPGGTAYITDLGMSGPIDSIIGMDKEAVLKRFVTGLPSRFEVAGGPARMEGVIITLDDESDKAISIRRFSLQEQAGEK
ncbi:MAG: TIGR00282 family metallophosphoesterase [Syntrophomonadaceae bacterium]|nr:TIGR00282 family metallophosphoesterase [Syntrophomonadaceae bacterium]